MTPRDDVTVLLAGLSLRETGHVLDISIATVEREWTAARAWLYSELTRTPGQ
jgi:hypothetical protein